MDKNNNTKGTSIDFQNNVNDLMLVCFGEEITNNKIERTHRFIGLADFDLQEKNGGG